MSGGARLRLLLGASAFACPGGVYFFCHVGSSNSIIYSPSGRNVALSSHLFLPPLSVPATPSPEPRGAARPWQAARRRNGIAPIKKGGRDRLGGADAEKAGRVFLTPRLDQNFHSSRGPPKPRQRASISGHTRPSSPLTRSRGQRGGSVVLAAGEAQDYGWADAIFPLRRATLTARLKSPGKARAPRPVGYDGIGMERVRSAPNVPPMAPPTRGATEARGGGREWEEGGRQRSGVLWRYVLRRPLPGSPRRRAEGSPALLPAPNVLHLPLSVAGSELPRGFLLLWGRRRPQPWRRGPGVRGARRTCRTERPSRAP